VFVMTDLPRPRILLVEDDDDTATLLKEVLENEGFDAVSTDSQASASTLCATRPRLIVVDRTVRLTRPDDELPEALRKCGFDGVPVLLVSAAVDLKERAAAMGAAAYIAKPFEIDTFAAACRVLTA
jgi:DNA-binding response OmpR family regulator